MLWSMFWFSLQPDLNKVTYSYPEKYIVIVIVVYVSPWFNSKMLKCLSELYLQLLQTIFSDSNVRINGYDLCLRWIVPKSFSINWLKAGLVVFKISTFRLITFQLYKLVCRYIHRLFIKAHYQILLYKCPN